MRTVRLICTLVFGVLASWALCNLVGMMRLRLRSVDEQRFDHVIMRSRDIEQQLIMLTTADMSVLVQQKHLELLHDCAQLCQELLHYKFKDCPLPDTVYQRAQERLVHANHFLQSMSFEQ